MAFGISKLFLQSAKDLADRRVLPCIRCGEDTGEVGLALAGCPLGAGWLWSEGYPGVGKEPAPSVSCM